MLRTTLYTFVFVFITLPALAHDGRRFEIKIVDDQLVAHGYISHGQDDMGDNFPVDNPGDPLYRRYTQAIHGHFTNGGPNYAFSTLPGYDILGNADALIGYQLNWEAISFHTWQSPATSGEITLSDLTDGEWLQITKDSQTLDSRDGAGVIELIGTVAGSTALDIDLIYGLNGENPSGEIHIIQSRLTTTAPGIADSDTIYTILSPAGTTMAQRLHHPSLYAESFFGTPVPEPASLALAALLPMVLRRRR